MSATDAQQDRYRHLPISWEECKALGWDFLDILLVTGDAYIDHPSFGVALIGRLLSHHGYRVAILPQPRYDTPQDFLEFPSPRLFCGVTGGNLDSIVANYSGNGKVRDVDAYSPGGSPWRTSDHQKNNRYRPDRASLIYANLAKAAFRDTPIILGGVEASLRRFVHFDYKQNLLRASFLTDAKADLLVYGMGELAVVEAARRCAEGQPLAGIAGTCERLTDAQLQQRFGDAADITTNTHLQLLPDYQQITGDSARFLEAELTIDRNCRGLAPKILLQRQQSHWVIQHPPAPQLATSALDLLYELPYTRKPHPTTPDSPAFSMIKDSVTIVRGCSGNCSFCAITRHQGAIIQNRSVASIVKECSALATAPGFKGTISDLGGPTANLYGTSCAIGTCAKKDCLYPELCKHLRIDENRFVELLRQVKALPEVRHLFISSGLRMELLLQTPALLKEIICHHTPGAMKIAPEHTIKEVLRLMHKQPHSLLQRFLHTCRKAGQQLGKDIHFVPYLISSHPGCTETHARQLADDLAKLRLRVSQFQDFTPTPGTLSTAMYVSGMDMQGKPIFVARTGEERRRQRGALEKRFLNRDKPRRSDHPKAETPHRTRHQRKRK